MPRFCDGVNRRSFLRLGAFGLGAMGLPQLLQANPTQGGVSRGGHKSVIMVYLSGGMSHHDTFDMKPDAPAEIAGEFKPIQTNVNGIQICELLPRLAQRMDQFSVVRSIVGLRDEHTSYQTMTGYQMGQAQREGKPNVCSGIARVLGPTSPVIPPFVDLFPTMQHKPYNIPGPGFLGPTAAGAKVEGDTLAVMRLQGVSQDEFNQRRTLLDSVDQMRRTLDNLPIERMDVSYRQAFEVLTSSKLVTALDLEREPRHVRDRYGWGSSRHQGDGAPLWNDQLLQARRLIEAGVRCVSVAYGFWDTHGGNFRALRGNLPKLDMGISALIDDLRQRGMDKDTLVIVWGEFGRTPKINKDAGRDHWAPVNTCLLAGAGVPGGQLIGGTDKFGGYVTQRPIHYRDILATVYHNLGVDPHQHVRDLFDRPVSLLPEDAQPVRELMG